MAKSLLFSIALLLFAVFAFPIIYSNSQVVNSNNKVAYELPNAGILPDHPLYFLKAARDRASELTLRDSIKRAELYLLLSDKRVEMADLLFQKGKDKLAITTLSKGEKYFLKIPDLLLTSRKQGVRYSESFVLKLKLSNSKHREIIEKYIQQVPQGEIEELDQILKYNQQIKERLNTL